MAVVRTGAGSRDFFGTAYGQTDGKYDGFQFGEGDVSFDDTLLLIEPDAARQYAIEQKKLVVVSPPDGGKADPSATATVGKPWLRRSSAMKFISPRGSDGSHSASTCTPRSTAHPAASRR